MPRTRPSCYIDDCSRPHHGQGLCNHHYTRQRKAALKDGTWENVQIDSAPLRERISKFLDLGYNYSMLEALSGIDRSTLSRSILHDRQTVIADNIDRLERVPMTPLYELWRTDIGVDYRLPDYLAIRRVKALMAKGWSTPRIAEEAGVTRQTIGRLAHRFDNSETIMRSNLVKIADAYDRLWDQEPPTPYHLSDLTKYNHWPLPMEWDDDEIDLPGMDEKVEKRAKGRYTRDHQRVYKKEHRLKIREATAV